MSFTAEVKDELSRVEGACELCEVAELSALVRVCGTLTFHGSGRYSIRIATETGAVARTVIKLTHKIFNLETTLTVRRSVLHKTRNYLIEIPEQDGLEEALVRMGVLVLGRGLSSGIAARVVARPCCRAAYLRGAFMAGGFIADPRGDFHLEIAVTGEEFADDLMELLDDEGITTRVNHRRGAYALYLKSFDDVISLLSVLGATRTAQAVRKPGPFDRRGRRPDRAHRGRQTRPRPGRPAARRARVLRDAPGPPGAVPARARSRVRPTAVQVGPVPSPAAPPGHRWREGPRACHRLGGAQVKESKRRPCDWVEAFERPLRRVQPCLACAQPYSQ